MSFSHPLNKPIIKGISVSRKRQYEIIEKSENVPKLKKRTRHSIFRTPLSNHEWTSERRLKL